MVVKKKHNNFAMWMAVATLVGVIVGAGVLGIPYVIAQSGFLLGFIIIVTIGLIFLALNLFMGEIILRTKGKHQLTGYMEKYLGKTGKAFMAFSMLFGIYGALVAYLIGEGQILHTIFLPIVSIPPLYFTLAFFVLASLIIFKGMKTVGKSELYVLIIMLTIILLISFGALPFINLDYLTTFHPQNFLIPLGVIIFAFISSAALPEMAEVLGRHKAHKKEFKRAIIIGSLIPIFIYSIFAFSIIGLVGLDNFQLLEPNERIATVALSFYTNATFALFANLFAMFAMLTSFLALGMGLVQMYTYDFHLPKSLALVLTLGLPLILALLNISTFFAVLAITGAIAGGIDGILIILAYWRAKKHGERKPEFEVSCPWYLGYTIIGVFLFGMSYQLYSIFF